MANVQSRPTPYVPKIYTNHWKVGFTMVGLLSIGAIVAGILAKRGLAAHVALYGGISLCVVDIVAALCKWQWNKGAWVVANHGWRRWPGLNETAFAFLPINQFYVYCEGAGEVQVVYQVPRGINGRTRCYNDVGDAIPFGYYQASPRVDYLSMGEFLDENIIRYTLREGEVVEGTFWDGYSNPPRQGYYYKLNGKTFFTHHVPQEQELRQEERIWGTALVQRFAEMPPLMHSNNIELNRIKEYIHDNEYFVYNREPRSYAINQNKFKLQKLYCTKNNIDLVGSPAGKKQVDYQELFEREQTALQSLLFAALNVQHQE